MRVAACLLLVATLAGCRGGCGASRNKSRPELLLPDGSKFVGSLGRWRVSTITLWVGVRRDVWVWIAIPSRVDDAPSRYHGTYDVAAHRLILENDVAGPGMQLPIEPSEGGVRLFGVPVVDEPPNSWATLRRQGDDSRRRLPPAVLGFAVDVAGPRPELSVMKRRLSRISVRGCRADHSLRLAS